MSLRHTVTYNQYRGHRRDTAPASEPITADEVKAHLNIESGFTDDDTLIALLITSAREFVEDLTGLAFITQTWTLTLDHWPNANEPWWDGVKQLPIGELYSSSRPMDVIIPRYPLQAVDTINADGNSVTVGDVFITDAAQMPGRLVIKRGQTWPVVLQRANGIVIGYTAGYGDDADDVPAAMRLALIQMVVNLYENRGDGCSTDDAYKDSGAKSTFDVYRARSL